MSTTASATYYETLQRYKDEFFDETGQLEATTRELAAWAIRTGRWEPPADLLIQKCREDFASALREEQIKDDSGPIRANQVSRVVQDGKQMYLWGDIRRLPRKRMENAVQLKREQMVGECRQIDRDCAFWNKLNPSEEPVQCAFDFTDDVEEGRFSGKFAPPNQPR